MRYGFINNFSQALAADLAAGATSLTLDGGGALLAAASTDYRFKLTLVATDAFGNETAREIVDVTAAGGDVLTIERQQEGTTSLSPWPSGTQVQGRVTAGQLAGFAPESIAFGPVDFSDPASFASWQAPTGRKLFVDSVEVVPSASGSGTSSWETVSGTPSIPSYAGGTNGDIVALSPDGSMLAVGLGGGGSSDPHLRIYNTADWTAVAGIPSANGRIKSIDWSPDGSQLAFATDASPYLFVHNTSDWTAVAGVPTLSVYPYVLRYKPDGTQLAMGLNGGDTLKVLNTADWTEETLPAITSTYSYSLGWSNDGTRLALSYGASPYLNVYDTADWSIIPGTPTLQPWIYTIAYSPDDTYLAYCHENSGDGLLIYEVATWTLEPVPSLPLAGALVWQSSGARIFYAHGVTNGESVQVISVPDWTIEASLLTTGYPRSIDVNAAGNELYVAVGDEPHLNVFAEAALAPPTLNLGTDAGAPGSLLAGSQLETFVDARRIALPVNAQDGLATLYAAPDTASDAGASALIVVRGYTLEG